MVEVEVGVGVGGGVVNVFVVVMNRWGDNENHSYVTRVTTTMEAALNAGIEESVIRDNKYEPEVICMSVDDDIVRNWIARNKEQCIHLYENMSNTKQKGE